MNIKIASLLKEYTKLVKNASTGNPELDAILEVIGEQYQGKFKTQWLNGEKTGRLIEFTQVSTEDLAANIIPKLAQVTAALKKVSPAINKVVYYDNKDTIIPS
jgi:hypothetical protein